MLLRKWLTVFFKVNRINRFSSFHLHFLNNQNKILNFAKLTFCTTVPGSVDDNIRPSYGVCYYQKYMLNNVDRYSAFHFVELIKEQSKSNPESLITDLFENLKDFNSDEQDKLIATDLSNWDIEKICKGIYLIREEFLKEPNNPNINKFMACINEELWKRKLLTDEILKILIIFKGIKFYKNSCPKKAILKLLSRLKNLSPEEAVQFFFGIPKWDFSKVVYKYSAYLQLHDKISQFNTDEMGIIAQGLVRANLTFNYKPIIGDIFNKMTECIENINLVPLQSMTTALLKLEKHVPPRELLNFQEKCVPYISNFETGILLLISSLGLCSYNVNSSFWEAMCKKFKEEIFNLSPTTLQGIVRQAVLYDKGDEEFFWLVTKEFGKFDIVPKYSDSLVYLLYYLTLRRIYPKSLLDIALSEDFFLKEIFKSKKTNLKFLWWALYCNIENEKPEYITFKINIKERIKIFRMSNSLFDQSRLAYSNSKYFIALTSMKYSAQDLYGEEAVLKIPCLPHYEDGLVLRFSENLEAQPIPDNFGFTSKSFVKKPMDDDHYWVFICTLGSGQYLPDKETLSIQRRTQYRQLEALGYIPIMVPIALAKEHSDLEKRGPFVSNLIKEALEKKKLEKEALNKVT